MTSEKRKGGRPAKAIKRDFSTGIRYTKQELLIVKAKANDAGLKITVYIRESSVTGHVIARLTQDEKMQLRALSGIANNLNQMAKKAHQEGLVKAAISFEKELAELERILGRAGG
jgi:hypothetical protein